MKPKDKKFIENWEQSRKDGLKKYVLSHGLAFGILMALGNLVWLLWKSENEISFEKFVFIGVVSVIVAGIPYALISWCINQYFYKKKTNISQQ